MCVQDRVVVHWWRELVATLEATNPTRLPFTCVAKYNFFFLRISGSCRGRRRKRLRVTGVRVLVSAWMGTLPVALPPHHILCAFDNVNLGAPMVRYSKLPFRALIARYNTHITTTPMILAEEFSRHPKARDSDFSTNSEERGVFHMTPRLASTEACIRGALVCQLAASHSSPLADAAELVSPYVDGIDLNCGCPQPWAYEERIGSYLLEEPELVADMIRTVKGRLGDAYCVSVKIRIDPDLRYVARYATFSMCSHSCYTDAQIRSSEMHCMRVRHSSRSTAELGMNHLAQTQSISMPCNLLSIVRVHVDFKRLEVRRQAMLGHGLRTVVQVDSLRVW